MNIKGLTALAGVTLALALGAGRVEAQGGGGGGGFGGPGGGRGFAMDPTQIRDTMLQNARDQLEVKDDAEWKVIGDQVSKVLDAQLGAVNGTTKIFALMRRNNNNGNGNGNGNGGFGNGNGNGNGGNQNGGQGRRAGGMAALFGGGTTPEDEALQSAIDRGAPPAELKTAIQKVETMRKQKQDALDKAHADLRALLTPRQEAIAITLGLL